LKRIILLTAILISLCSVSVKAQNSGFGIGIIAGEPSGLSLKSWISENTAIDGAIAYSFVDDGSIQGHVDYLIHNYSVFNVASGKLPLYYGIGGRIKNKNDDKNIATRLGARVPVGICYQFAGIPMDVFLELVPVVDVSPKTQFTFNGAVGIRYFIK